ncbi:hypothetical protein ACRPK8_15565 [Exiguobacterium sp. TDN 0502]|uniref:hypothetical protein n=1 Tax=Exiguobacterium sp. TDN 0502 TaxID=3420731 RepID=UPI003D78A563
MLPETSPTIEDELNVPEQPELSQEKRQTIAPALAGVALLGASSLSAAYSAETKTITLENTVSGLLSLNLTSGYIIFQLPKEVMQSIDSGSVLLQYRYSGVLGSQTRNVTATIDPINNQIYADVSALLKVSLLSSDRFTLSFDVGKLPVGVDRTYTFRSVLADGLIDLNLLSTGMATATLGIGPTFGLLVPATLDFGSHELTGHDTLIPRLSPMIIEISHENAAGYNWQLQASLSRPLTSTDNDVLSDVLYFKTASKTQLLQATAIEIATGTMSASSNQTPLIYAENEGIILDLTGKYPKPSSYSADIQWSLVNAP